MADYLLMVKSFLRGSDLSRHTLVAVVQAANGQSIARDDAIHVLYSKIDV